MRIELCKNGVKSGQIIFAFSSPLCYSAKSKGVTSREVSHIENPGCDFAQSGRIWPPVAGNALPLEVSYISRRDLNGPERFLLCWHVSG